MKNVNVGILGGGFISNLYMSSFKEIPEANVVAVCQRSIPQLKSFAKKYKIPKIYAHMEDLCKDPDVEVVTIGLPNYLHKKAVILAAENGKHIICTKPFARNVNEAKDMLKAAEKAKIIHCYAENAPFVPQYVKAKEIVDDGSIGKVLWVKGAERHFGPHSPWFWDHEKAGGGSLIDIGVHSIEVGRWFIGKKYKPVTAFCWGDTLLHKCKVEDNSIILVRHEKGQMNQAESSWSTRQMMVQTEIYGTEGKIFIDTFRKTGIDVFTVKELPHVAEKAEVSTGWLVPAWEENRTSGVYYELKHFIDCILKERRPRETFEDGYLVNKIVDAGYKSMTSGKWESI